MTVPLSKNEWTQLANAALRLAVSTLRAAVRGEGEATALDSVADYCEWISDQKSVLFRTELPPGKWMQPRRGPPDAPLSDR